MLAAACRLAGRVAEEGDVMRVSEMMRTPVVTCRPSSTLAEAAQLMGDRDVGCVVVVDGMGYVAGILTDRDIALRGVGTHCSAETPVETIMTRAVASVTPLSDIGEAAEIMHKKAVRRLPVIDDYGELHGMITFDDLLLHLGDETVTLADTLREQKTRLGSLA